MASLPPRPPSLPPPPFAFDARADGVEVRQHPLKGRCLVATREFAPGDVVLRQQPYAVALVFGGDGDPGGSGGGGGGGGGGSGCCCCDYCHRPVGLPAGLPPALRCSRCKLARYCSPAHQRAAWAAWHREECAALADAAPRRPPLTLRLAARALWRRRRERRQQAAPRPSWRDGGTWDEVEALRDGWDDGAAAAEGGGGGDDGGSSGGGAEAEEAESPGRQLPLPPEGKLLLAQMGALLVRYYDAGVKGGAAGRGGGGAGIGGGTGDGGGGGGGGSNGGGGDPPPDVTVKEAALLLSRIALNAHALAGGGGWGCGAAGDGGGGGGGGNNGGGGRGGGSEEHYGAALAPRAASEEQYGGALAPRAALLNHCASPNVLQRFSRGGGGSGSGTSGPGGAPGCGAPGGEACFVAVRPVRPGEELTVAYADVAGGAGARASPLAARKALRGGYLFDPLPGGLAAGLPLRLPPLFVFPPRALPDGGGGAAGGGGGRGADRVRVRALSGGPDAAAAAAAAAADPRGAVLAALAGGLGGGVDISLLTDPPSSSDSSSFSSGGGGGGGQQRLRLQGELLALAAAAGAGAGADWPAAGETRSAGDAEKNRTSEGATTTCVAVGWGPWCSSDGDAAAAALAALGRRFLRAERLRAHAAAAADAGSPRVAAGVLAAALRLLEDGEMRDERSPAPPPLFLRLAPTQPLPLSLRAALSDALLSAAVQEGRPRDEAAAWREARDGALALERAAPPGWPALGLRLARAASIALRVAQDGLAAGERAAAAATAAEGAALGERGLRTLAATHGSGWGDEAAWVVRNAAQALQELRHIAGGGGG